VGTDRVTTIGRERATNPVLQAAGEDAFVEALLASLGTFPDYFLRLGGINRQGPAVLGTTPPLAGLAPARIRELQEQGAQVVDVRSPADFAAGHIPGSLSNTLRPVFATWLGWLVDPGKPLVIVRSPDQEPDHIVWEAAKVGFETLAGELAGGMAAWSAETETEVGPPSADIRLLSAHLLPSVATILDVRQAGEYAIAHIPGALNIELGRLPRQFSEVPDGPVTIMCGHGERAMTAASILTAHGRREVSVLDGGPVDWRDARGISLQESGA
jgi:rhodanese-related sulfurtransferase